MALTADMVGALPVISSHLQLIIDLPGLDVKGALAAAKSDTTGNSGQPLGLGIEADIQGAGISDSEVVSSRH